MMNIFDKIRQYTKFENREDIDNFEKAVWDLAASVDPQTLEKLVDLFDDECAYYEVMYSLVHAIETYPDEIYVEGILRKTADAVQTSPLWLDCLCNRIFNNKKCLVLFKKGLHVPPKESLLQLFNIMEVESPHHRELIDDLRKELAAPKADS
ncbi:MAG: Imm30 family immunity protein [Alphaproteobacteria bacterium]